MPDRRQEVRQALTEFHALAQRWAHLPEFRQIHGAILAAHFQAAVAAVPHKGGEEIVSVNLLPGMRHLPRRAAIVFAKGNDRMGSQMVPNEAVHSLGDAKQGFFRAEHFHGTWIIGERTQGW
jgi:hypothetical protein